MVAHFWAALSAIVVAILLVVAIRTLNTTNSGYYLWLNYLAGFVITVNAVRYVYSGALRDNQN